MNSVSMRSPAKISMLERLSALILRDSLRIMMAGAGLESCPHVKGSDVAEDKVGGMAPLTEACLSSTGEVP